MKIRIKYLDESTADAEIRISDRFAWEKTHKKTFSEFEKNPALGDILWMAHRALSRVQEGIAPFDTWVNQIDDFDVVDSDPKS